MSFWKDVGKALVCGAAGVVGSVAMTKVIQKLSEPETKAKAKKAVKKTVTKKTSVEENKKTEAE